jgi:hypothetical protein
MSNLLDEIKEWNTPIVGAYLLWHFSSGYQKKHINGESPVVYLHFIANAILTDIELSENISRRRKNLESYVRSFIDNKKSDVLAGLHQRVLRKRENTLAAIDIAVANGLLVWDCDNATLCPRELQSPRGSIKLSPTISKMGDKAFILGEWFSRHDLVTITSYLGVLI